MNAENMMNVIGEAREAYVDSAWESRNQRKHRSPISFVSKLVLVAAIIMSMTITVYASDGDLIKILTASSGKRYSSFEQMERAMEEAKVDFEAKESFANGYAFEEMHVGITKGLDEDRNELLNYKELDITYTNPEGHRVSLSAHPNMESIPQGNCPVKETRLIGDIPVEYLESTYLNLPAKREGNLTEEEKRWQEQPGNYIGYFSWEGEAHESQCTQMRWVKDGIDYLFTDIEGNATANTLFSMAEEMING